MELSEQEVIRRESLQKMRDMGIDPYPAAEYVVTGYSTEIKATFEDDNQEAEWYNGKPVRIAGRLMSRRIMVKRLSLSYKTPRVVSKYMYLATISKLLPQRARPLLR